MGIAVGPAALAIGTHREIWDYRNQRELTGRLEPPGKHDAVFVPRNVHYTGDIRIHEIANARRELATAHLSEVFIWLGLIAWTKLGHIFLAPTNGFFKTLQPYGRLSYPANLLDENAEQLHHTATGDLPGENSPQRPAVFVRERRGRRVAPRRFLLHAFEANRFQHAIDVEKLRSSVFSGRSTQATGNYPAGLLPAGTDKQAITADTTALPSYRVAQRGMVRTFQLSSEFPRLTLLENMMVSADHVGASLWTGVFRRRSWKDRVYELLVRARGLLDEFGLLALADEYAGNLSGGQKRLLELALVNLAFAQAGAAGHPQMQASLNQQASIADGQARAPARARQSRTSATVRSTCIAIRSWHAR